MENEREILTPDTEIVEAEKQYDESKMVRRYMLTINNPTETDEEMGEYIESYVPDVIKYCVFQREKGEETGTQHFQMFIQLKSPMRFRTFKKMFPRAHIEPAVSNVEAREYCKKEDTRISATYYEFGVFAEERGNHQYKEFYKAIDSGLSDREIRDLFPTLYPKMENTLDKIRQDNLRFLYQDKPKENFIVCYIYGKSGVGKTYDLFNHYKSQAYIVTDYDRYPFDDYKNEDVLIFDDYHTSFSLQKMLKLIDEYPINLPRRFKNVFGNYTKVFFTANEDFNSQHLYDRNENREVWKGFERRVHFILRYETREKIIVEKASKSIEELQKIISKEMFDKLDTKFVCKSVEEARQQVMTFTPVDDDDLPF